MNKSKVLTTRDPKTRRDQKWLKLEPESATSDPHHSTPNLQSVWILENLTEYMREIMSGEDLCVDSLGLNNMKNEEYQSPCSIVRGGYAHFWQRNNQILVTHDSSYRYLWMRGAH